MDFTDDEEDIDDSHTPARDLKRAAKQLRLPLPTVYALTLMQCWSD